MDFAFIVGAVVLLLAVADVWTSKLD